MGIGIMPAVGKQKTKENNTYSNGREGRIGDWVLATEPSSYKQYHGKLIELWNGGGMLELKNGKKLRVNLQRVFGPVSEFE